MSARHFLSIADLRDDDLVDLVRRSVAHSQGASNREALAGSVVGTYFRRTSTRTRTAFSSGALKLGAQIVAYGPGDLQENTGEIPADTGRVLSAMLDAFVVRTAGDPGELREFAKQDRMSVINAMSADEHPTQAVTDLSAMHATFGRVDGLRVLYVGEGNNTSSALALALARFDDVHLELRTPLGYGVAAEKLEAARNAAGSHRTRIEERHDVAELPTGLDVVYTTRWCTTGTVKEDPDWLDVFEPFRVDAALMESCPGAVFMHDLPAHRGQEVSADVLDGPTSIAFLQAEHKLYGAMAVLEWCLR